VLEPTAEFALSITAHVDGRGMPPAGSAPGGERGSSEGGALTLAVVYATDQLADDAAAVLLARIERALALLLSGVDHTVGDIVHRIEAPP